MLRRMGNAVPTECHIWATCTNYINHDVLAQKDETCNWEHDSTTAYNIITKGMY